MYKLLSVDLSNCVQVRRPQAILMDVEGTTTSIKFVKDVLFPIARHQLRPFLDEHWGSELLNDDIEMLRQQIENDLNDGLADVPTVASLAEDDVEKVKQSVVANVCWQMDQDRKTKALKQLQGHLWATAYQSGLIKGHVYEDVPTALERWKNEGIELYIYSSGSVSAQKLLFGYSDFGDMLPLLKGHFDTSVGSAKVDSSSYLLIAQLIQQDPSDILFLTDIPKEAIAANEAGLQTLILTRTGNAPLSDDDNARFKTVNSFLEIDFI